MITLIIITTEGGIVQDVFADEAISDVVVVDLDCEEGHGTTDPWAHLVKDETYVWLFVHGVRPLEQLDPDLLATVQLAQDDG